MGFHVDACEVRSPEQKGKTERRVGDCKGLDLRGRCFDGLAGLQTWTDAERAARVIQRICPATGLSVAASWEAEKPFLRPLPELLRASPRADPYRDRNWHHTPPRLGRKSSGKAAPISQHSGRVIE